MQWVNEKHTAKLEPGNNLHFYGYHVPDYSILKNLKLECSRDYNPCEEQDVCLLSLSEAISCWGT